MQRTMTYARAKLALGIMFALFGIGIIVQGMTRVAAKGILATAPLFVFGVLLIALGYTRYRTYRAVVNGE